MTRIPFVAAVVGALLIGGATTGGTHASWLKTATLSGKNSLGTYSVKAGSIGLTPPASVAFASNFDKGGAAQTTSFIVTDDSKGKNLLQQVSASVSQPAGFTVALGATCPGATSASATSANKIGPGPSSAKTTTFCVKATPSSGATTGSITVTLGGQQKPTGWTAPSQQFSIPVTVNASVPGAPVVVSSSCSSTTSNSGTFTWGAVSGATSYTVYRSDTTNADASYNSGTSVGNVTSYTASMGGNMTSYFRVKTVNASGSSVYSNTVQIVRSGNTNTCSAATP